MQSIIDVSSFTRSQALEYLDNFNPSLYAKTRNYLDGQISYLSDLIKHGVIQNR